MILWTMQPIEIWNMIQEAGVYHCDPSKCSMPEFTDQYDWLIRQMEKRIGPPPEGVSYPVWAWYSQNNGHRKPDLRSERWGYGPGGELYSCIEFEIPDNQVLLSDFGAWHHVLNNWPVFNSGEEYNRYDDWAETVSKEEKWAFLEENWEKVLVSPREAQRNINREEWIQATVWELRKEMIRRTRFFKTGKYKLR